MSIISIADKNRGATAKNAPVKSRLGEMPRVYASSFAMGRMIERGNFLCAGYMCTRLPVATRQKIIIRVRARLHGKRMILALGSS